MRWLRLIAAKTPAAAFRTPAVNLGIMTAFVTIALTATFAFGPGTANAIEHSGEPSALARRSVPAMASPEVATLQMSTAVTGVLAAPREDLREDLRKDLRRGMTCTSKTA